MITKEFITAGNATFTVEVGDFLKDDVESKPHYTFKVLHKPANDTFRYDAWLVSLLSGPENTSDYTCFGLLTPETGKVRLTQKSPFNDNTLLVRILRRVLARIWAGEFHAITDNGWDVHHEGRCGRCGRKLTVPESIQSGFGPECTRLME